ncbi:TetR/AcrR family transcriptional regulator [Kribbella shirazensis]|uniref:AcrR family transcriptional regulator n=1 Tax=Kribbella shirazensis TaxID=1105143 RepID=A0A7X5VCZ0_9ACTN|nr:TetR/AcrR family transcriptional regulator [Kribbella shirazensis]NIK58950.1 AcrR family transcriptional regulator [Kribbella shirazensis]
MTAQAHHAPRPTKRQLIIETAERLFAEHGYDATSTARIATEAGVPSGLVFYHFATKLDLLIAVVQERPEPSEVLRSAARPRTVRGRLRAIVASLVAELENDRAARIIVFREAQGRPEIASRAAELFAGATATVADLLSGADDVVADAARVQAAAELVVSRVFLDTVALGQPETAAKRHAAMVELIAESLTSGPD